MLSKEYKARVILDCWLGIAVHAHFGPPNYEAWCIGKVTGVRFDKYEVPSLIVAGWGANEDGEAVRGTFTVPFGRVTPMKRSEYEKAEEWEAERASESAGRSRGTL